MSLRIDYEERFETATSHKSLWGQIVLKLNKEGVLVTVDQAINTFKALKRAYRAAKDNNEKSGGGKKLPVLH